MSIANLRIIADRRERKSGIPDLLRKAGTSLDILTLDTGDYIVSSDIIVERKSIRDFVSSIVDGRLYGQCTRLKNEFKHPVLIMEGDSGDIAKILDNPFVFYSAVSKIAIEFGIPVIQTPNATHTAKLLIALGTRKGIVGNILLKKPHKKTGVAIQEQQLNILCALPGIGEKLATRMLEKFATPRAALLASVDEIALVENMGPVRAKRLCDIIGSSAKSSKSRKPRRKITHS